MTRTLLTTRNYKAGPKAPGDAKLGRLVTGICVGIKDEGFALAQTGFGEP
jgi:hypothetical protein